MPYKGEIFLPDEGFVKKLQKVLSGDERYLNLFVSELVIKI